MNKDLDKSNMDGSLSPILVGEDDPADVFFLERMFDECQIRNPLKILSDGGGIIRYLQGVQAGLPGYPMPVMLVLDWVMWPMGGEEVLDWLQTQPKPSFPVVILTGLQSLNEMQIAYQKGSHSFLVKPLQKADVCRFMEKFKGIEIGMLA